MTTAAKLEGYELTVGIRIPWTDAIPKPEKDLSKIRETIMQLWTPEEVRGRVNAVNQLFIGASNQLGDFRAGISATLFGTIPAVLIGGIGTLGVVLIGSFRAFHDRVLHGLGGTAHRLHEADGRVGRDGRVDGVAAGFENVDADLRR